MLAEQQLDFAFVPSHQGRLKSAPRTTSPLRHCGQGFHKKPYDFWTAAIEGHSQQIASIFATGFRMKIGRAGQQLAKDFDIAMLGGGHQRRKTIFVGKVDQCTGTDQPLRRFPILL
jgi:hypothetical protein